MLPRRLDHVALYVSNPEETAELLLRRLPFRVLESGDDFLLLGRSPSLGKLTLFSATFPRERGALVRIGLAIPCGTERTTLELPDGLVLDLVPAKADGDVDLDHVALEVRDPASSAREWARLGLERADAGVDGVERVRLGPAVVELHAGDPEPTERPLLNHIGLLVDSIEDVFRGVAERGIEVTREVDAENSIAVFVAGPDGVEVEYIEQKPSFALA